jgi:AcrR family transcriptional regulator
MARAGRRPGPSTTSDEILDSARRLFAERGFHATTIRAVASEAGVNPALVHHFFGGKEQLFVAALRLPVNPAEFLIEMADGPRAELGARIVRRFIRTWRDPASGQALQAVLRAGAATEQGAVMLRRFAEDVMLERASTLFGVPRIRLAAAISQLLGFALLATVLKVEPLASADEDELVGLLAPTIQRYLDG